MPETRPGDFAVVCGTIPQAVHDRNWGAALIEAVTRGPAYHALICTDPGRGIEARPHGAGYVQLDSYDPSRLLWSTAELTDAQRANLAAQARKFIGTPYGWGDDLAIGLDALGLHAGWVRDRLNDRRTVICSQLVAVCYVRAGIPLCDKDPSRVTPNDLRAVIQSRDVPANY